mgnify:CR=1 FL=1
MTLLADRAAEEDVKEEMLLYSALAKAPVNVRELKAVDEAIETYIKDTFDLDVDFDISDALSRLKQDGLITELPDGTLRGAAPARRRRPGSTSCGTCASTSCPTRPPPATNSMGQPGDRRRPRRAAPRQRSDDEDRRAGGRVSRPGAN